MFKNKTFTAILAVTMLSTSMLSIAAPRDFAADQQLGNDQHQQRFDQGPSNNQYRDDRDQRGNSQGYNGSHQQGQSRNNGPRPSEDWQRGQPIPQEYRGQNHYVNDWQNRNLPQPPKGHRWLEVNGDYVLVAIATSIITAIFMGNQY
ncbi:RcnB family protein [Acinetobacter puyangensis]|uniref:RcnB family protein n=1 Tax=Acinetobacter puyangensis TaxID=1096779 RepID=UPI003A4D57A3